MSFIYDGNMTSPQELAKQRALYEAMLQRGGAPASSIGEGLAVLGQAFAGRMGLNKVKKAEAKNLAGANGIAKAFMSRGQGAPVAAATPAAPGAAPAVAAPGGMETRIAGDLVSGLGISPAAASGIVGNLSHETGGFKNMQELKPVVPGSRGGYGWAQWTGPRRKAFESWAAQNKLDPASYEANLGFLKHELTATPEGKVLGALKGAKTPDEAARIFSEQYLRPGIPHMESRLSRASAVAKALQGAPSPAAAPGMNNGDYLAQFGIKSNNPGLMDQEVVPTSGPPPSANPQGIQPGLSAPGMGFQPQPGLSSPQMPAQAPQMAPQPASQIATGGAMPMPQKPMTAYQRMMQTSLGKEAGGLAAPPNRSLMASVMGQGAPQFENSAAIQRPQSAPPISPPISRETAAMPAMAPGMESPAASPAAGGSRLAELESYIFDPYFSVLQETNPAAANVIMKQYEQEYERANTPADPMKELQQQKLQLEVEKMQNPEAKQPRTTTIDGTLLVEQPDGTWKPAYSAPAKPDKPPAGVQEYQFYVDQEKAAGRQPVDFFTWEKAKAPSTNVNVNSPGEPPDGELRKSLDKQEGDQLTKYKDAATVSGQNMQDFAVLDELIKVAPQGPITGRIAEMFPGVSSSGDAFRSIVVRVAPTLRAPGSGATSDIEYEGMLRSLPALKNKPEANMAILQIMKDKAALNIKRGDVITRYQSGEISAGQLRKELNDLNKVSIISPQMQKMISGFGPTEVQPAAPQELAPAAPGADGWVTLPNGVRVREKVQ
jgi:hypothetical protein